MTRLAPMMRLAMAVLMLALGARGAHAQGQPVLVPEISKNRVEITSGFNGEELLLFGTILYPGGWAQEKPAEIAVVLKGPFLPITVREKQKIGGIWINAETTRFRSAPSFYAVASSRPLRDLVNERTASIFELGLQNLQLSPASGDGPAVQRRFEEGLLDLRRREGVYAEYPNAVQIKQGALYRASIPIPARVPVGRYVAETYLIQNGRVLTAASLTVEIGKSGFERFVANAAQHTPVSYGLIVIILSVVSGWAAGIAFRRK